MTPQEIKSAQKMLGYTFNDEGLLKLAITHASLVDSRFESNERLEFLGDAVLGLVVCEYLHNNFEDLLEGEMTKIKSAAVSRRTCAKVANERGLPELLRLGKGMSNRLSLPSSVVAAVYEALIGAIFVDGGMEVARAFILDDLEKFILRAADSEHQSNFKSVLQQAVQQVFNLTPVYVLLDEQGPDHSKCFEVRVEIGTRRFTSCWGPSKKQAEQQAALQALIELEFAEETEGGEVLLCPAGQVAARQLADDEEAAADVQSLQSPQNG